MQMHSFSHTVAWLATGLVVLGFVLLPAACTAQTPVRILIVYYSEGGKTAAMAEAVAAGARTVSGTEVTLRPVAEATPEQVVAADAIILGSPVYNANVAPPLQAFINRWPFEGAPLRNKIGAAFVTAGGISAGEELVQLNLLHSMLIFGMVVVGGPEWSQAFGASAITEETPFAAAEIDAAFLAKGEALGRRVAELAVRWSRCATPSKE